MKKHLKNLQKEHCGRKRRTEMEVLRIEELATIDGGVNGSKIFWGATEILGGVAGLKGAPATGVLAPLVAVGSCIAIAKGVYDVIDGLME